MKGQWKFTYIKQIKCNTFSSLSINMKTKFTAEYEFYHK